MQSSSYVGRLRAIVNYVSSVNKALDVRRPAVRSLIARADSEDDKGMRAGGGGEGGGLGSYEFIGGTRRCHLGLGKTIKGIRGRAQQKHLSRVLSVVVLAFSPPGFPREIMRGRTRTIYLANVSPAGHNRRWIVRSGRRADEQSSTAEEEEIRSVSLSRAARRGQVD